MLASHRSPVRALSLASLIALALLAVPPPSARADEGMWTFTEFPKDAIKKKYGFSAEAPFLERAQKAALSFGGFCTASFVSPEGLVMTNHHCARSCVQELSTEKMDLAKNGFYAKTAADEKKCPGLEVRQLVGIEDVTPKIDAATKGLPDAQQNDARKAEMTKLEKACVETAGAGTGKPDCSVVTLWRGGRYHLYKYRKYDDVRLVFAPEAAIAAFGGDPDNFNFPRYDLDNSFVRVWDGGKPFKADHFFPFSARGPANADLVFVVGNPGSTQRLYTVAQLEFIRDVIMPQQMRTLSEMRGMLVEYARRGGEAKRTAQAALLSVENNIKRTIGQFEALTDKSVMAAKAAAEAKLRARVNKNPKLKKLYGGAWDAIAKSADAYRAMVRPYQTIEGGAGFSSSMFRYARTLVRAAAERAKPDADRLREYRDTALGSMANRVAAPAPVYKELEELQLTFSLTKMREWLGADDLIVKKVLGKKSPEELAHELVGGSKLGDPAERKRLWDGGKAAIDASNDPMIVMARLIDDDARALRKRYETDVDAVEKKAAEDIARATFALDGISTYPDATGTLRVTYGTVKGYEQNGQTVPWMTTIGGTFARATGREPFALPPSWLAAEKALAAGTTFNFVSDTDIIGGNSGSPVINREGEVVGLAFDGNIQSLGGAYVYDGRMNRTVSVSSAGIVEALRTVYKADRLVQELAPNKAAQR